MHFLRSNIAPTEGEFNKSNNGPPQPHPAPVHHPIPTPRRADAVKDFARAHLVRLWRDVAATHRVYALALGAQVERAQLDNELARYLLNRLQAAHLMARDAEQRADAIERGEP